VLVGLREIVCTLDPETCDYFLKKNFKNYVRFSYPFTSQFNPLKQRRKASIVRQSLGNFSATGRLGGEGGDFRVSKLNGNALSRIFTANGDEWKMHRHLAKPLFRTSFIDTAMVPLFISHTDELLHDFDTSAKKKEPIEITKVTLIPVNDQLTFA